MTETIRTIEVTEVALDTIIRGPVDAIKIDVEGVELMVLDGIARILSENPAIFLWVEWAPYCMRNAGYEPMDLLDRLRTLGFSKITVLDDRQNRSCSLDAFLPTVNLRDLPPAWYVNLLAQRT